MSSQDPFFVGVCLLMALAGILLLLNGAIDIITPQSLFVGVLVGVVIFLDRAD